MAGTAESFDKNRTAACSASKLNYDDGLLRTGRLSQVKSFDDKVSTQLESVLLAILMTSYIAFALIPILLHSILYLRVSQGEVKIDSLLM